MEWKRGGFGSSQLARFRIVKLLVSLEWAVVSPTGRRLGEEVMSNGAIKVTASRAFGCLDTEETLRSSNLGE